MRLLRLLLLICLSPLGHAQDPASPQVPGKPADPPVRASDAAPSALPDTRSLMLDVERNQASAEAVSREYTYHVHMRNEQLNRSGALKKVVETDAESFTIDGVRVNRVYARDGKPLTPEEARKEDEAVDKTVARAKQHRAQHQQKGQPTDAQGDVVITASRMLELGTFSNLRRGEFRGRPVWIVDFAGDPAAKTRNEFESVMRNVVGTAWIDQQDRVLVAAHGEFRKDFKVGAGLLVNIHQGSSFDYQASKVANEVWLLDTFSTRGSLRYLLFGGFNGRIFVRASDYRKFRTSTKILPSNRVIGPDGKPVPEQTPVETTPGAAAAQTGAAAARSTPAGARNPAATSKQPGTEAGKPLPPPRP